VKDAGLSGRSLVLISLPLFLVGIAACLIWYRLIRLYRLSIGWRHDTVAVHPLAQRRARDAAFQANLCAVLQLFKQLLPT
jgi:hypothetical protein